MAKNDISKKDFYIEEAKKSAVYVDAKEGVIGVYATMDDAAIAEKSHAIKKLRSVFKFKIQMLIK